MRFEIAHDFRHAVKATSGVTLVNFLNKRGHGFVAVKHFPMWAAANNLVANGRPERPIAVHHASDHPVLGLLAVLLLLML
ncbi:MAG TPA: hypothetical protein VF463_19655 [Sphingobium sp.]